MALKKTQRRSTLYLLQSKSMCKVGVTSRSILKRRKEIEAYCGEKFEIIYEYQNTGILVSKIEYCIKMVFLHKLIKDSEYFILSDSDILLFKVIVNNFKIKKTLTYKTI